MGNNRDWILDTLSHKVGLAVPYNFLLSPAPAAAMRKHYGTDDLNATMALPMSMTSCASIKPLYASPAEFGPTVRDEYGVTWSTNEIDRGFPIGPALSEADLSGYTFPDPTRKYRFEQIPQWIEQSSDRFTVVWVGDLWERATFIRGMEHILMDVAVNEAFVQQLLRGIADYILATMEILFERFEFDAIAISDDYGMQRGMLMSPDSWRKLIKPPLAEIYALAKKHGRFVFHHSCGNIVEIIGEMIDIGLDILHPIQPEAMDILALKREFGRDVSFCGGLRTQDLLPTGTPQEIRDEVRRLKDTMGASGGYILEPGITVQADVPLDNLIAMIEEARV